MEKELRRGLRLLRILAAGLACAAASRPISAFRRTAIVYIP